MLGIENKRVVHFNHKVTAYLLFYPYNVHIHVLSAAVTINKYCTRAHNDWISNDK